MEIFGRSGWVSGKLVEKLRKKRQIEKEMSKNLKSVVCTPLSIATAPLRTFPLIFHCHSPGIVSSDGHVLVRVPGRSPPSDIALSTR